MTTILDVPGSSSPNPFSAPLQALLSSTNLSSCTASVAEKTAAHLIAAVTTSSNPSNALWQLWDAFFTAVVTSPGSHAPHIAFLDALRAQPPTQPNNIPAESDAEPQLRSYIETDGKLHWLALPRFRPQWVDVHDILEAKRGWDGVRASGTRDTSSTSTLSNSPGEYYLRFCIFSAVLLKATKGKGEIYPVWVFYECRNVLEREGPESNQLVPHRMPPEQVWALDVRVVSTWVRDGGWALWETDQEELRRHYAATLDFKTDLWPREDGLTRKRWQLWGQRLRALSIEEEHFDEVTRAVVTEAAEVVESFLREITA